ncbi:hypothetical protein Fcan01_24421 [Folsomia candida]|uniref:Uncharacterized protein n=1 Tax=Folsomia candida TaxID=158441 RepID=A0A226D8W7_FOLCA|nr:hypothetical protein Fcan01_24421 [Folsomia candida]
MSKALSRKRRLNSFKNYMVIFTTCLQLLTSNGKMMKPWSLVGVLLVTLTWMFAPTEGMCARHYPHRGCQCQCGGELNGHCHCPFGGQIPNVYCRNGGNHMICFPWAGGGCPFPRCYE